MKEDTKRWLEFADMDLKLAELALENSIYIYSAHHSQQAVEKYLKAFLIENNIEYPRTHNIKLLIDLCKRLDKDFNKLLEIEADRLTFYAIEAKYPEMESRVSREEAEEAIKIAKKVRDFVKSKVLKGE